MKELPTDDGVRQGRVARTPQDPPDVPVRGEEPGNRRRMDYYNLRGTIPATSVPAGKDGGCRLK